MDVALFEAEAAAGRASRAAGDIAGARERLRGALELYGGDLLPEDGPADWVVERRERCRLLAVGAAQLLAELCLAAGDAAEAASACGAGLAVDRYHDPLWRLLIEARERAGDPGAASRARQEYAALLSGLGLSRAPGEAQPLVKNSTSPIATAFRLPG